MNKIRVLVTVFLLFLLSFSFIFARIESEPKDDPLCGPKSLLIVCQKLGVRANLDELKRLSDYDDKKGTTMAGLYKAVQAKGLDAVGMEITLEDLSKVKIPVIVFLWGGHFEVIDRFEKDRVRIIGPDDESKWISKTEFSNNYSGMALLISKDKKLFPKIDTKGPDLIFDEYFYNFGIIEQFSKRKIEHIFKFRNIGNSNLLIERVSSPCGCTAAVISDKDITPGGKGEIKATVDVEGRKGEQTFVVFVQSNDPITPIIELQVKGIIQRGLKISPSSINFGGDIKKGFHVTKKLFILAPEGEELSILNIEPSSKYLSTKVFESGEKDNKGFEVEVTLASEVPMGKLEETLIIHTSSTKSPTIEIPVTGNIKGNIELRPDMFFFGSFKKGETPTSKVTISTKSEEPLKIEKIDPEPLSDKDLKAGEQARFRAGNPLSDYISVTITPKTEGKEYEITATLKDNAPVGTIKGTITIRTNNSDQPTIEITIYALVRE